ncbi:DUF7154 domain-containing protein [Caenorhabditis elegans]|uniref:DUF7154 domain-containing protein n=1 Tax=Caenorhabditis elegans TaxID=6239 RepID=O44525_CAEEL|nr:VWFA domain-containing protein [Caenorhabditis elegans]CCD71571.1 VWFA domain-containing protein [Caenorhabditis elegans]|eukprot:NP_500497.1 Uncharacterized protein CELE_R07C12.1 [Caenorhabditis elegans]
MKLKFKFKIISEIFQENFRFIFFKLYISETLECLPADPKTILFAYSNDLEASVVSQSARALFVGLGFSVKKFANVRFDTSQSAEIYYSDNFKQFNTSVNANLPDPSLGFKSSSIGSDSLKIVENFYDISPFSLCGSIVVILSKRNPNENDITNLVTKVRSHHGMVHVISSNTPSGGSQPLTLYDLSSKTNGLTDFRNDDQFYNSQIRSVGLFWPVVLYAVNTVVSGNGSTVLPPLLQPCQLPNGANFAVTVQNHGPIDTFQSFHLSWYNASSTSNGGFHGYNSYFEKNSTIRTGGYTLDAAIYNMTLDYSYSDNTLIKMQIRQYNWIQINYWPPYAD